MVDINVDKVLHNEEIKIGWEKTTIQLLKVYSFQELLNSFLNSTTKYNTYNYKRNKPHLKTGFSIIQVADYYGIKPLGKKLRICPFHIDKNPSLSLSEEKECFNCFGCGMKGGIFTFVRKMEKIKNGQ